MKIRNEAKITGPICKKLRTDAELSQVEFWGNIGLTQGQGSKIEKSEKVSRPYRYLIFARYVSEISQEKFTG